MDYPQLKIYDNDGISLQEEFHLGISDRIKFLNEQQNQGKDFLILWKLSYWETMQWIWSALCAEVTVVPLHASLPEHQVKIHLQELPPDSYFFPFAKEPKKWLTKKPLPELSAVLFTSGSTGSPKAIALGKSSLQASAQMQEDHWKISKFFWFCNLWPSHIGGFSILSRAFFLKSKLVFSEIPNSEEIVFKYLAQGDPSGISMVPTQVLRLVTWMECNRVRLLSNDPRILVGGARLDPSLEKRASNLGLKLYATYGMTEMSSQVATALEPGGNLQLLPRVKVATVQKNEPSEIMIQSPSAALGQFVSGTFSPLLVNQAGFWPSGDLGSASYPDLFISGRSSEVINSGGVKFFPAEIENYLLAYPLVAECAILGVDDPEWGTSAVCFCVLHNHGHAEAELREYLRGKVDARKIPKKWVFLKEFPRTHSGKIDRKALRNLSCNG